MFRGPTALILYALSTSVSHPFTFVCAAQLMMAYGFTSATNRSTDSTFVISSSPTSVFTHSYTVLS